MTTKRSDSIDYASQCTVCIEYQDERALNRIVYERPQMPLPEGQLTQADLIKLSQYQTDGELTEEAQAIFSDMQRNGRIGRNTSLGRVFIARTAAAALEMDL